MCPRCDPLSERLSLRTWRFLICQLVIAAYRGLITDSVYHPSIQADYLDKKVYFVSLSLDNRRTCCYSFGTWRFLDPFLDPLVAFWRSPFLKWYFLTFRLFSAGFAFPLKWCSSHNLSLRLLESFTLPANDSIDLLTSWPSMVAHQPPHSTEESPRPGVQALSSSNREHSDKAVNWRLVFDSTGHWVCDRDDIVLQWSCSPFQLVTIFFTIFLTN